MTTTQVDAVLGRLRELRSAGDDGINDRFLGWLIGDDPARAAKALDKMLADDAEWGR